MSSENKNKRRDVLTAEEVADLFRRIADQIEAGHSFLLDGLPITVAKQVRVRQEFHKEGALQSYALKLSWDETYDDTAKLGEDPQAERADDLPEPVVPPLDLPGPNEEDQPCMSEEK